MRSSATKKFLRRGTMKRKFSFPNVKYDVCFDDLIAILTSVLTRVSFFTIVVEVVAAATLEEADEEEEEEEEEGWVAVVDILGG